MKRTRASGTSSGSGRCGMPKISANLEELKKLNKKLTEMANDAEKLCKYSLYDAAGIAVEAIGEGIDKLSVVSDAAAMRAYVDQRPTRICYTQREGLYNSLGLTPMTTRGGIVSIKAGFDNKDPVTGYNAIKTKRWPKGQPNIIIAASCEHGSSAMIEQPFIRPAFERNKGRMREAMKMSSQEWIRATLEGRSPRSRRSSASKKKYRSSKPVGFWTSGKSPWNK